MAPLFESCVDSVAAAISGGIAGAGGFFFAQENIDRMAADLDREIATEQDKAGFRSMIPADPAVVIKPMFGNLGAFVNGNMTTGLRFLCGRARVSRKRDFLGG